MARPVVAMYGPVALAISAANGSGVRTAALPAVVRTAVLAVLEAALAVARAAWSAKVTAVRHRVSNSPGLPDRTSARDRSSSGTCPVISEQSATASW